MLFVSASVLVLIHLLQCITLGHACAAWKCACYYNGVYYDENEVWPSKDDVCTVFKCKPTGTFYPIQSGCSFKGNCYDIGATWNEGCYRYECQSDGFSSEFRLIESGCVWNDGNCYAVGEKAVEHCDTYQCQIDGGCYVMNKIKSECKTGDAKTPCQPVSTFWHDRCAVYQCGSDDSKLIPRILTHSHDVMMWPRGHYALLETDRGCPNYDKSFWYEGWCKQCGDHCSFTSQEFHLKGNYTKDMFQEYFCIHHDVNDPTVIPLYQTYWEPGQYCILRYNGTCPKGFSEGFVQMNNNACGIDSFIDGFLPDGNFTQYITQLRFCCRYDGHSFHPIVLPAKHPFVLFMASNATECQAVQGMTHRIEFWSFCDVFNGLFRQMGGALPSIKTGDNNTLINYCLYEPVGCACTDEDERAVAITDQVTKNCVTKQCQTVAGHNVMVIVKGGCMDLVNDKCRDENDTWTETQGETCVDRTCIRKVDHKHTITFHIVHTNKGCRLEGECVPLNYTQKTGCYERQCQEDPITGRASFKVTVAGCSIGRNQCISVDETHVSGCFTYICTRTESKCSLKLLKGACKVPSSGNCIDEGEDVRVFCTDYICAKTKENEVTYWRLHAINPGCSDNTGKCYPEGYRLIYFCMTYECKFGSKPGFYLVAKGCRFQGRCYNAGTILNDTRNCITYQCGEDGKKRILDRGCPFKKVCYNEGDIVKNGKECATFECMKDGSLKQVTMACYYKSKCYSPNEQFKDGCNTYLCTANSTSWKLTHLHLACKVGKDCIDPGVTFKRNCHTYVCKVEKYSCSAHLIEYGCRDPRKRLCVQVGGVVRRKCADYVCQPNGTSSPYKYLSRDCSYNGKCLKQGETILLDRCQTVLCDNTQPGNTSSPLMAWKIKGCLTHNGECLPPGHRSWDTSGPYYCTQSVCKNGRIYDKVATACKDANSNCIKPADGQVQSYQLKFRGYLCTAECHAGKKIRNLKC